MKVAIWANSPSLHQHDFYQALRAAGVDLRVLFLSPLRQSRRDMGWDQGGPFVEGEQVLPDLKNPLRHLVDWKERIHIIPGYSRWTNVSIALELSRAGVPWVHWSENSQPSWRSYLSWAVKKSYAQLVNRCALGAFAHGEAASRDFIRWGIRPELTAHLHYAVRGVDRDADADVTTAAFVAGRLAFVFVGTICRNKASKELVKAFAAATTGECDACLVVVGNGPLQPACEHLAGELGVADRVLFRGVVRNCNLGSVLRCCDVAVLPSRYDGWGVVLNEAASAGLALIASDATGAAYHLIEPGLNGFRVAPGNVRSLASAMGAYVESPALAMEHGRRSLQRFADFRPERNVERFTAAIRTWLSARPRWRAWQPTESLRNVTRWKAA